MKKNKDATGRRHKYGRRQPRGNAVFNANDLPILLAIQRHGMLPSNYILPFSNHKSLKTLGFRLTQLRHELGMLQLVDRQQESGYRLSQCLTYELTPLATKSLEANDLNNQYTQKPSGWATHALMTACFTASIELACRKHGFGYIDQEAILSDDRCTHKKLALPVSHSVLIPDQLFGIRYGDKVRFFALEADRASEDTERIDQKLAKYQEVYRNATYKAWGIPNLTMLYFTTGERRAKNFLKQADAKQYLANYHPYFVEWRIPPVMNELFDKPWMSTSGEYYINRP